MTATVRPPAPALLLYEPQVEGHHPGWLRFLTEDLLSAGYQLTLAVDLRPQAKAVLADSLGDLLARVKLLAAVEPDGRRRGGSRLRSVQLCLAESGAPRVFLCEFDQLASTLFRQAAVGCLPPAGLRGRMGGIYHRPRFMAASPWSPNRWLKQAGFRRLLGRGWLRPLLLLDPYLVRERRADFPSAPIYFLPNPCPTGYDADASEARRQLGVPPGRRVFLFYGGGYRRKGLHVAVAAMRLVSASEPVFLLCVGRQNPQGETAHVLEELTRQGRALLIDRYVSAAEERLAFAAADVVLLPYLNHFGISAVLSQAAAARKPVIASDEQLLGRLTRDYRLGLLFPSGDAAALADRIREAAGLSAERAAEFIAAAGAYAGRNSRAAYRAALLQALEEP